MEILTRKKVELPGVKSANESYILSKITNFKTISPKIVGILGSEKQRLLFQYSGLMFLKFG